MAFGLQTSDLLFLLNTLILSATLVPGCCWVFCCVCFFFFSEQELANIWLEGRKETVADPYSKAGAHPHSLPSCWKDVAKHQLFLLKKRAKQLASSRGQLWTYSVFCTSPMTLCRSKQKAYWTVFLNRRVMCVQVPKNADPANIRFTLTCSCVNM